MSDAGQVTDAVATGDLGRLDALLAASPTLAAARDADGVSLLLRAVYGGHDAVVERLLAAGLDLDVFEAAALGDAARLRRLLDADPSLVVATSPDGWTPLHLAAHCGHPDAARLLLDRGADVEATSDNALRVRPLHSAVAGRQRAVTALLLARGADPDARQRGGRTPLLAAAEHGDGEMVRLLLAAGADTGARDDEGRTAADLAGGDLSQLAGRTLTVGLLGCGTVGAGVVRLLRAHAAPIAARLGARLELGPVAVRDPARDRGVPVPSLTTDPRAVVAAAEVDVVVEVMGGVEPAHSLLIEALQAGKHVVTANKELIASRGPELFALAHERGVRLEYEAAVAGAVPIIRPLSESLAGDRVRRVLGILNGTTNYVLTRMTEDGVDFDDALADAQRLGYAEADPTADVEGHDAAAKVAILASLAFDARVSADQVHREGITAVTATDIAHARRMGYVVKLLAIGEDHGDGQVGVRVHPALVPTWHPLASVRHSYNAVFVEAEAAGGLMFYGPGAGAEPTASAVIGDLVTVARTVLAGSAPPDTGAQAWGAHREAKSIRPFAEATVQSYVLLDVADEAGVLAAVASAFAGHGVSIKSVWQDGSGDAAQLLLITHAARERAVQATLDDLRRLPVVRRVAGVLRVEGGEAALP